MNVSSLVINVAPIFAMGLIVLAALAAIWNIKHVIHLLRFDRPTIPDHLEMEADGYEIPYYEHAGTQTVEVPVNTHGPVFDWIDYEYDETI